jgi:hypothetical protein
MTLTTEKSQVYWIITKGAMTDKLRSPIDPVTTVDEVFPGFNIDVDPETGEESRGTAIKSGGQNSATFQERILCNYLSDYPMWKTKEQCERVAYNLPLYRYNPEPTDAIGRPTFTDEGFFSGKDYYAIPFLDLYDIDEMIDSVRIGEEIRVGVEFPYPLLRIIPGIELETLFDVIEE